MNGKICQRNIDLCYERVYESASGGFVDLHPLHGEDELWENLEAGKILSDHGFKVELLPTLHAEEKELRNKWLPDIFENKNPDVRINGCLIGDFKRPDKTTQVKRSTIKRNIHSAGLQKVDIAIINLSDRHYTVQDVKKGVVGCLQPDRNRSLRSVWIITNKKNLFCVDREIVFDDSIYEALNDL